MVNATPLGMQPGDPLLPDPGLLSPAMLVAEVAMKPRVRPFLTEAKRRPHPARRGGDAAPA
jgi:shikimate dehydrogenase